MGTHAAELEGGQMGLACNRWTIVERARVSVPEIRIRVRSEKRGRNDGVIRKYPETQLDLLMSTTDQNGSVVLSRVFSLVSLCLLRTAQREWCHCTGSSSSLSEPGSSSLPNQHLRSDKI